MSRHGALLLRGASCASLCCLVAIGGAAGFANPDFEPANGSPAQRVSTNWQFVQSRDRKGAVFVAERGPLPDGRGSERAFQTPSQAAVGAPTCTTSACHAEIPRHDRPHKPILENRCQACHEPKRGATPYEAGVRHEFKRSGDSAGVCYACHDRPAEVKFVHAPVRMGVCILCHDPHGAPHASLLRTDSDRQLCRQCHRITVDQGRHVHEPVAAGQCMACHNPHGSDHAKFARSGQPELCLDCHDALEELLDEAAVPHGAMTAERSCLGCHDPHGSDFERLGIAEQTALCLSCHDRELDVGGRKIADMAKLLKEHPDHHGPIREGKCTVCHNPHGAEVAGLLRLAYPADLYAPYEEAQYALCFECHEVEMVEEDEDEEVTAFRNGDANLHLLHVKREDRGLTCRACHDVHAGQSPGHMADGTSSAGGPALIAFEGSETGGSCQTGCHSTWSYDREDPIRNEKP